MKAALAVACVALILLVIWAAVTGLLSWALIALLGLPFPSLASGLLIGLVGSVVFWIFLGVFS